MREPGLGGLWGEGGRLSPAISASGPVRTLPPSEKSGCRAVSVFGVVAGERSRRGLQRTVTLALRRASLEKGESGGRESVLVACLGGGGCRG